MRSPSLVLILGLLLGAPGASLASPGTAATGASAAQAAGRTNAARQPRGPRRIAPRAFQRRPLRRSASPINELRFAVIGDTGTYKPEQAAVAEELLRQYDKAPFGRLIMLGDNVYSNGEHENFGKAIAPYQRLIDDDVRVLGILGNHDIRTTRGKDQLRFYGLNGRRWYKSQVAHGKVELFFLDTTLYIPGQKGYREGHEKWRDSLGRKQLKWIERALAASHAPYKIVVGHHPLYSSGGNGRSPEGKMMQDALGPILKGKGVQLYLSGHDHHYERGEPVDGVTHIVSGNGGGRDDRYPLEAEPPRAGSVLISKEPQLMSFELKADGLHYSSIDSKGGTIDQGVFAPASTAR